MSPSAMAIHCRRLRRSFTGSARRPLANFGTMASIGKRPSCRIHLDALARDVCYRVDEVLKTAPHETTEVVYFVGQRGELGPFVRKRIAVDAAMGDAYGHLFQAQRDGRRFRHLPRIYDVHTTGNELVVVMEYIQGRTLRDEVYERDGSVALAAQWFPLLCDGVMELHEQFRWAFDPSFEANEHRGERCGSHDHRLRHCPGLSRGGCGGYGHSARAATRPPEQFQLRADRRAQRRVWAKVNAAPLPAAERDPSPSVAAAGSSRGRKCLSRCAPCSSAPAPLIRRPASRRCAT